MSVETSPYEGKFDALNGKTCLGRVISVDQDSRTVRVRTIGAEAFGTDDQDLQNVKCQHFAWHPDGDYAVSIPRIGTYVLVSFINSEPVVVGVYPISNTEGGGGRDNQENLLPGDYAFVTVAGNRIIIRSAGTVEIESTKGCRTYWMPSNETINTICQNYELEPVGGYMHWTIDPDTAATVLDIKAFDNAEVSNAARLQFGSADSAAMVDLAIGPVDDSLNISEKTLSLQMQADGSTVLNIAQGKIVVSLGADGKLSITTAAEADLTIGGNATIGVSGDATINASGAANISAGGNVNVKGSQISLNGSASGVTTKNSHMGVIDLITGAPVQPSTTVMADI